MYSTHNPGVKAGVAWYGRLVGPVNDFTPRHPTDLVGQLKAPVLGLYGGLDTGIPLETVEAMEKALQQGSAAAKASEIHVYDNAPHMLSTPTIARATARKKPKMAGNACWPGSAKTACKRHFEAERAPFVLTFAPRPEPVSS